MSEEHITVVIWLPAILGGQSAGGASGLIRQAQAKRRRCCLQRVILDSAHLARSIKPTGNEAYILDP